MSRRERTNSKSLAIFLAAALALAMVSAACKSNSESVVSGGDSGAQANNPSNAAQASVNANPSASATPATGSVPTTPVGPVGQTSTASAGKSEEKILGNIPVTVSPAKPALTPEPDPFPARPTPTVVVKEGKIIQQWQAPAGAANLANPVKDKPDAAKIGREYYMQKCADCHGKAGKGNGYLSGSTRREGKLLPATNLASQMVQANSDGELFWKITNGRSPMPAHRIRFDDEQRWHIVAYLRTLK